MLGNDDVSMADASSKVCGKLPESEEQGAKDEMVTEGNLEESCESSREERLFEQTGFISSDDILRQLLNIPESESLFTLPGGTSFDTDSEEEYDEETDNPIEPESNLADPFPDQGEKLEPDSAINIHYIERIIEAKERREINNLLSQVSIQDVQALLADLENFLKVT